MELRSHRRSGLRSLLLAGLFLVAAAGTAAAQKSVLGMIGKDIEHAGRDIGAVWLSPFDASARDLLAGIFVIGLGAAVSPADDDIDRWAVRNQNSSAFDVLEPVRKGGFLYSGNALAPVAGAVYIVGIVTKRQGLR